MSITTICQISASTTKLNSQFVRIIYIQSEQSNPIQAPEEIPRGDTAFVFTRTGKTRVSKLPRKNGGHAIGAQESGRRDHEVSASVQNRAAIFGHQSSSSLQGFIHKITSTRTMKPLIGFPTPPRLQLTLLLSPGLMLLAAFRS